MHNVKPKGEDNKNATVGIRPVKFGGRMKIDVKLFNSMLYLARLETKALRLIC